MGVLRLQHVNAVDDFARRAMKSTAQASLNGLLVHDLERRQNIFHLPRLLTALRWMLQMPHCPSRLEMFCKCCVAEVFISLFRLHFSCYLLVTEVLPMIMLLLHKLSEVFWIEIRLQLLQNSFEWRKVLMFAHACV